MQGCAIRLQGLAVALAGAAAFFVTVVRVTMCVAFAGAAALAFGVAFL